MKIINVFEKELLETPHKVDVRLLYDDDSAQIVHILLEPGETLKPHITPVDVAFYVLEGSVDVRIGNETKTVHKDNLVESPKDIIHCLSNSSKSATRVLVIKAPKPTSQTRLL